MLNLLYFVANQGDEGQRWVETFRPFQPLGTDTRQALVLFWRRQMEEGRALLERVSADIESTSGIEPSIRAVLERWYYGVLAYYFYCVHDLDQADEAIVRANQAVITAVGCQRVLLPMAVECYELCFHRARIARSRHRWQEVREYVAEVRGMMDGRLPFCVLGDGSTVLLSDVKECYAAFAGMAEEQATVSMFLNDRARLREVEQTVRDVYRIPGHVIQYR